MIKLRELKEKDAPLMLEWMHDKDIAKSFRRDMSEMRLEDTLKFCKTAQHGNELNDGEDRHFAIVDEQDEYLGTISLKGISLQDRSAEYAISTRRKAHGKGIAYEATKLILHKAFKEYGLHRVYLNVLSENEAAIRLYERCGFQYEGKFRHHLNLNNSGYADLCWYGILEDEFSC